MLGIDLTLIERFKNKSEVFAKRILTEEEYKIYLENDDKAKFLANRWAIKEAIFKADNSYFEFNKMNIEYQNRIYKFDDFIISTSSENGMIIAIVMKKHN